MQPDAEPSRGEPPASELRFDEPERGSGPAAVEPAVVRAVAAQRRTASEEVAISKADQPGSMAGVDAEDIFRLAAAPCEPREGSRAAVLRMRSSSCRARGS